LKQCCGGNIEENERSLTDPNVKVVELERRESERID